MLVETKALVFARELSCIVARARSSYGGGAARTSKLPTSVPRTSSLYPSVSTPLNLAAGSRWAGQRVASRRASVTMGSSVHNRSCRFRHSPASARAQLALGEEGLDPRRQVLAHLRV